MISSANPRAARSLNSPAVRTTSFGFRAAMSVGDSTATRAASVRRSSRSRSRTSRASRRRSSAAMVTAARPPTCSSRGSLRARSKSADATAWRSTAEGNMVSAGSSAEAAFRVASETVPAASVLAERADTVSSTPNVTTIDAASSPASSRFSARTRLMAGLMTGTDEVMTRMAVQRSGDS